MRMTRRDHNTCKSLRMKPLSCSAVTVSVTVLNKLTRSLFVSHIAFFEMRIFLNWFLQIRTKKFLVFRRDNIPWTSSWPSSPSGAKKKNFSPLRCTGRWKLATNGGSWQHFYKRLNALRSARIESREDSKRHSVAEIEKNGCFFAFYECCTIVLLMVVYNRKYIYTSMNFLCEMLFLAAT